MSTTPRCLEGWGKLQASSRTNAERTFEPLRLCRYVVRGHETNSCVCDESQVWSNMQQQHAQLLITVTEKEMWPPRWWWKKRNLHLEPRLQLQTTYPLNHCVSAVGDNDVFSLWITECASLARSEQNWLFAEPRGLILFRTLGTVNGI